MMTFIAAATTLAGPAPFDARYRLVDQPVATLAKRLFGHFMERPSWGNETGVEAAVVPGTHRLQPSVIRRLRELNIPVLRFPSGTDNDYVDWTDMIDDAPGRADPARPDSKGHTGETVSNRFGYDEFLPLARSLGSEIILPVRFRDGLLGTMDLKEAARRYAAALAAYVNAPVGAKLPDGLEEYAALRARHGHAQPWKVEYFQIGNETWFFNADLEKRYPGKSAERYAEAVEAFVDAIHAVDPTIRIIADGVDEDKALMIRRKLGDRVAFLVDHWYSPWAIDGFKRGDDPVSTEGLTEREIWGAWAAPWITNPDTGEATFQLNTVDTSGRHGYPVAITEYNWNGWWGAEHWRKAKLDSQIAKGVGLAGFLHSMMRHAGQIKLACMSMTIGKSWEIDAIRVDSDGKREAYFMPTGQVVGLYSRYHGDSVLRIEAREVPTYPQPFSGNGIRANAKVQLVDTVATSNAKSLFLHVVNRDFERPARVVIDPVGFGRLATEGTLRSLVGPLQNQPDGTGRIVTTRVRLDARELAVVVPPRSVSVVEIARK
jgi:alpha-L-arabinofuranosidase